MHQLVCMYACMSRSFVPRTWLQQQYHRSARWYDGAKVDPLGALIYMHTVHAPAPPTADRVVVAIVAPTVTAYSETPQKQMPEVCTTSQVFTFLHIEHQSQSVVRRTRYIIGVSYQVHVLLWRVSQQVPAHTGYWTLHTLNPAVRSRIGVISTFFACIFSCLVRQKHHRSRGIKAVPQARRCMALSRTRCDPRQRASFQAELPVRRLHRVTCCLMVPVTRSK